MENLIKLLLLIVNKIPFASEADADDALDLLRQAAEELGATGVVPPKAGPTNAPAVPAPEVEAPGPVAEPVPPEEQTPPPTSPEVAGTAPEEANAFSGTDSGAAT